MPFHACLSSKLETLETRSAGSASNLTSDARTRIGLLEVSEAVDSLAEQNLQPSKARARGLEAPGQCTATHKSVDYFYDIAKR